MPCARETLHEGIRGHRELPIWRNCLPRTHRSTPDLPVRVTRMPQDSITQVVPICPACAVRPENGPCASRLRARFPELVRHSDRTDVFERLPQPLKEAHRPRDVERDDAPLMANATCAHRKCRNPRG